MKSQIGIDVCANCGDIVVDDGEGWWAHYRGRGSRLNRCQHTVLYGRDATPAHDGAYFPIGLLADETADGQANTCRHDSATGIDTAPMGPDKVWRCDHCGLRWMDRDA